MVTWQSHHAGSLPHTALMMCDIMCLMKTLLVTVLVPLLSHHVSLMCPHSLPLSIAPPLLFHSLTPSKQERSVCVSFSERNSMPLPEEQA